MSGFANGETSMVATGPKGYVGHGGCTGEELLYIASDSNVGVTLVTTHDEVCITQAELTDDEWEELSTYYGYDVKAVVDELKSLEVGPLPYTCIPQTPIENFEVLEKVKPQTPWDAHLSNKGKFRRRGK